MSTPLQTAATDLLPRIEKVREAVASVCLGLDRYGSDSLDLRQDLEPAIDELDKIIPELREVA